MIIIEAYQRLRAKRRKPSAIGSASKLVTGTRVNLKRFKPKGKKAGEFAHHSWEIKGGQGISELLSRFESKVRAQISAPIHIFLCFFKLCTHEREQSISNNKLESRRRFYNQNPTTIALS